ncbi:MAG: hypothetical protein ACI4L7_00350 [Christensenellales bacterium]
MTSNEILKHYREKFDKDGFVDISNDIVNDDIKGDHPGALKTELECGAFYKKLCDEDAIREQFDAEVLLSQVYSKLGFKSAIYVPVKNCGQKFVLSNDISSHNTTPASEYHFDLAYMHPTIDGLPSCLFQGKNRGFSKLFDKKVIRKRTEVFLTDATAMNIDRVQCNYFYILKDNKPVDIILIDYEKSGDNFNFVNAMDYGMTESDYNRYNPRFDEAIETFGKWKKYIVKDFYQSDFDSMYISRKNMIKAVKECEDLEGIFDREEFAERLGSVNVKAVAKDIKRQINYEVNQKYVDILDRRFEETAEMLVK